MKSNTGRALPSCIEELSHQTITQVSGTDGPYMVYSIQRTLVAYAWNPKYNQDAECRCGHTYHRHFDSYENMHPVGCKYCQCNNFELKVE